MRKMFSPAFQRRDAMPSPQMGIAGFKPGDSYFILDSFVPALKCRVKHNPAINHRDAAPMMFSPAFQRRDAMPFPRMGIAGFKPGDSCFIQNPIVPALKCRAKHNPAINRRGVGPRMHSPAIYCRGVAPMMFSPAFQRRDAMPSPQMGIAGFKPGDSYFILKPIVPALKCRAKHIEGPRGTPAMNCRVKHILNVER